MLEINEANFVSETANGLVLVDFFADWCGPCRLLTPILEQITGIKIAKVNVDDNQDLAATYNVTAIPKLLFMKDGQVVDQMVGLPKKEAIQEKVNKLNESSVSNG